MHIVLIHQYFTIPTGCGCLRSYEFARRWVNAGHKVTVITATADRSGLDSGKRPIKRRMIEGIDVVVSGVTYSNFMSFFKRKIAFLRFMFFAIYTCLKIKDIDVIYAISTPLFVGVPPMIMKRLKGIPFVFEVSDRWPASPIEQGFIKNKVLIKILLWLEMTIYKHSSAIVTIAPSIADWIRKDLTEDKEIVFIPNGCETERFRPGIDGSRIRKEYRWENKLVFLHAGAMGMANGLDFVIDACIKLKDHPEILFVLLGDGSRKATLQSRVKELALTNVQILPFVPQGQLPEVYAAADVGLVTVNNSPVMETCSCGKFFDTLIAGKPVLLNFSGWTREVIEAHKAGFGCKQYDLQEFIEKVLYLNSHREEILDMGRNARQLGVDKYDRQKLAMGALDVINSVLRSDNKDLEH